MRIGIITINDRLNYGNRLQNYAVQRVIEEIGGKGEILRTQYYIMMSTL